MLVNFIEMLQQAKKNHFAVPQFNINNLEWTKYILEECEKLQIPVILGVSEGAAKYMGGYSVAVAIVKSLMKEQNISIPVCIHLDHGSSFESCRNAIDSGFTSVMIDGSKYSIEQNVELTKSVVDYAHKCNVSVEAEVGHIGGTEDNTENNSMNATLEDCTTLYNSTGIDALAPALGSVHGFYKGEPKLDFKIMEEINETLPIPLVLHGGTGIPAHQISQAITCGISKININTEIQSNWSQSIKKFMQDNPTAYDPRKIIGSGEEAIKNTVDEKVKIFNTQVLN